MHVRFTTCAGMPVTDDQLEEDIGTIGDILIHPDTATIEGFFVVIPSFLHTQVLFLPALDIMHFGSRVRVRHAESLSPVEDIVRLQSLLSEKRPVLGQRMLTESGKDLGICRDVQFETRTFHVEWFYPRKWFRWRAPIAALNILEIREDAIVVRDPVLMQKVTPAETVLQSLEPLTGAPLSRVEDR